MQLRPETVSGTRDRRNQLVTEGNGKYRQIHGNIGRSPGGLSASNSIKTVHSKHQVEIHRNFAWLRRTQYTASGPRHTEGGSVMPILESAALSAPKQALAPHERLRIYL